MFDVRFPFRCPPTHEITPTDDVVELAGRTAKVSGFAPWYVLVFSGFADEAEAARWIEELRVGLAYLALQHHVALNASFEVGSVQLYEQPQSLPRLPLSSLADGVADGAQPIICPTGLRVRTVTALPGTITVTQGANFLLRAFAEWQSLPEPSAALRDRRLVTALDLYCAQLVETSPNAKFLLLISSLESICTPVPRTARAASLLDKWRTELLEALEGEDDRMELESFEAVQRELSFRRCTSIARQLRTLVREALAGQDDVEACVDRIVDLYSQRSKLLHTGRFEHDDQARISDAQSIVRRVLCSKAGLGRPNDPA
jgi:hypothetical protein